MAEQFDHRAAQHAGVGSVEESISQHDAFGTRRGGDGALQISDRFKRATKFLRRVWVQLIRFRFDGTACPREVPAAEALGDEPLDAGFTRSRQKQVRSTRPQLIGARERTVEMPEIRYGTEISHFMNDNVRLGGSHGSTNSRRIEAVGHNGFRTRSFDRLGFRWRTRKSDNRVTCRGQCGNKRTAHSAGGACNKNSHVDILIFVATARQLVWRNMNSSAQM